MATEERWSLRVADHILFVDDLNVGAVALQHNARPDQMPYIHPLRIADGRACLTEDSPWHHPHQHGIQLAFAKVNGCDFWVQAKQRPEHLIGSIKPSQPRILSNDPPTWAIETIWQHSDGTHLLAGQQIWTWSKLEEMQVLDIDWTLLSLSSVNIAKHPYGGLFIRMPFRISSGADTINSAGQRDSATEQQPASWVDVHMPLEHPYQRPDGTIDHRGINGGMAVLDHPENPGHPSRWRVDYQRGINPCPCNLQNIDLPAGTKIRFRYRLILHTEPLPASDIETLWRSYCKESN